MGLMLLVLLPVPYVDASAATVFRSRGRRALVGAAGMLVEVFIAALAFDVWLTVEAGLVRALAFNVMVVAGVSTLVFNGNPLLRYDAYYILADLIAIPNLAQRSLNHWAWLLQHHVLGLTDIDAPTASAGERAWFVFYGVGATIYRTLVTVTIAWYIAGRFFFVGVVLALWALFAMAVMPLYKVARFLFTDARVQPHRLRAVLVCGGGGALLLAALALLPLPDRSQAEGVVWLPEQAAVRAGANGFVRELLVADGAAVAVGTPLIHSVDPALVAQIRLAEAGLVELEARYASEFVANRANADALRQKLVAGRAALAHALERAQGLTVQAAAAGIFRVPQAGDLMGRYHKQGALIGYVVDDSPAVARVVINQGDLATVELVSERVQVRLAENPGQLLVGRVLRQVPAGSDKLPSRVLAQDGGGRMAVDPRDSAGTKTLERNFQVDIELSGVPAARHFGERVFVRFEHPPAPLLTQWYRELRRLLLRHFNV
jgi:putative peptide zinc metalloprotease protein